MSQIRRRTNNVENVGVGTWRFDLNTRMQEDLGLDYITIEFAGDPAYLVNITLEFLFAAPAATFVADGSLTLCGSYKLDAFAQADGVNGTGTSAVAIIGLGSDSFQKFVDEFLADRFVEISTPY